MGGPWQLPTCHPPFSPPTQVYLSSSNGSIAVLFLFEKVLVKKMLHPFPVADSPNIKENEKKKHDSITSHKYVTKGCQHPMKIKQGYRKVLKRSP